ncbi:hypothetical protein NLI96_g12555 [Meripilus lineatus]|uniref:Uncharacterized protein n=1 Tax=Meripilus lineatus TaxID=2056292 RepID=A0AAD5URE0_9APHY|nr:hypothetical protein NLI96_g12555 [Physisporinus lineatus]
MSARRPKFSPSKKYRKAQQPIMSGSSTLIPVSEAPWPRLPPATRQLGIPRQQSILSLPARKRYIQIHHPRSQLPSTHSTQPQNPDGDDPFIDNGNDITNDFTATLYKHNLENPGTSNAQKRQRQWQQWQLVTIPLLIDPYLDVLWKTRSLRDEAPIHEPQDCNSCPVSLRSIIPDSRRQPQCLGIREETVPLSSPKHFGLDRGARGLLGGQRVSIEHPGRYSSRIQQRAQMDRVK